MKKTSSENLIERIPSGIKNLDALLGGGLVKGAITVLAGTPGAGKTTLAQQICFSNATKESKALIFQTLSEPPAKTMRYMSQFDFFKAEKMNNAVEFVDLGTVLRADGVASTKQIILDHIKRTKPSLVVIDSFKVFEDLTESREHLRKFTYEIAVQLMAWEVTGFLLGEYGNRDIETSPLFSVVDGIITMKSDITGDGDRCLRIVKMRGTKHDSKGHHYEIGPAGIEITAKAAPRAKSKSRR